MATVYVLTSERCRRHLRIMETVTESGNISGYCTLELTSRCKLLIRSDLTGGESGIRTLGHPLDSARYRHHIAGNARNAADAVDPCTLLHAGLAIEGLEETGRCGSRAAITQRRWGGPERIGYRRQDDSLARISSSVNTIGRSDCTAPCSSVTQTRHPAGLRDLRRWPRANNCRMPCAVVDNNSSVLITHTHGGGSSFGKGRPARCVVISAYYHANDHCQTRQEARRSSRTVGAPQQGPQVGSDSGPHRPSRADRDRR